MDDPQ